MTVAPKIDVRDLKSVRNAAREGGGVVLGEDFVSPRSGDAMTQRRKRRGLFHLRKSPIARKIITFNLLGLIVMVAGVLYLDPARDNLTYQRGSALVSEVELIADVFEAQLPINAPVNLMSGDGMDAQITLENLDLRGGLDVYLLDRSGTLVQKWSAPTTEDTPVPGLERGGSSVFITRLLNGAFEKISGLFGTRGDETGTLDLTEDLQDDVQTTLDGGTWLETLKDGQGRSFFKVLTPVVQQGGASVGVIALVSSPGELDDLVARDRERLLQVFFIGVIVSIALSLVLASTIAHPLSDLAKAAELGRDRNARKKSPHSIQIPDLTGRPDEIGRLSGALRGMVSALFDRIEGNEQFAADVAHEIKNPLASLRSAVGTLRNVTRQDHRDRMLEVIEHDVQRLDRLVSDISNASRLDSELVKEEEEAFNLIKMLGHLTEFLGNQAKEKGVDFISDLPEGPIEILGLEGRLAQVFVNLISNAISFCEDGDAIRVWVRKRENRVLVVVEDTGPGIPDGALQKVFQRFYSERPEQQFGDNSGLGLAISKQIVEAHGGVIWAENIRPTDADIGSDPLGARFVVGLPV
ncbi:sensor histidine kinase [Octadecabacter sp. 1_MG-2023]|uniref:sensor histidine kinase n=1 Tax=unclassified Octadecabacter TaxID=196158 RepID=UPI001C0A0942|nr:MULTISPECIES: sensor histidine kinase [unclassified Octadecabacter]MBU2992622.1 sensor histidine kinase [Octadecabacter sp. B2R22]MDO6734621.1 sensor histidine kinase [Octadecabacter sp. 1_MG-2023]